MMYAYFRPGGVAWDVPLKTANARFPSALVPPACEKRTPRL